MTDVFMLIGYMDPNIFLGGTMRLDPANARRVFDEKIARPLGMSVEEAAFGIYRVATAQISDLIHEITVERGLDPRTSCSTPSADRAGSWPACSAPSWA